MKIRVKYIELAMAVTMLTALCFICCTNKGVGLTKEKIKNESTEKEQEIPLKEEYVVVLDAGHGGNDPGKVGVNGSIESEINLSIVKKLKVYLEEKQVKVVLTREDENGLYDAGATNKKRQDMERRCEIVNDTAPDMLVSIHQNSYPSKGVKGAQVFYFNNSYCGEEIAATIQKHLKDEVDNKNGREHKENTNYYILKNVECPAVIVECGFLSNYSESELLVSEDYQNKLAVAIGNGILDYLENR